MKPNYIIYLVIGALISLFIYSQFIDTADEPTFAFSPAIVDSVIVNTYPRLYEAIYERNASELEVFRNHDNRQIAAQAWRALASTPIDSLEPYIEAALQSQSELPWFAISLHDLTTEQLRSLESYWLERPEERSGISLVLGRQGDKTTLDFLLNHVDEAADRDFEFEYAMAVGRLLVSHPVNSMEQNKIIERAFLSENEALIRAYLYGFYRGNAQDLSAEVRNSLYGLWKEYGLGNSFQVDQYMVRLLGEDVFYEITLYQNSENLLDLNIQLAVELAQAVDGLELDERNTLAVRMLLMHENPHVAQQTLSSLEGNLSAGGNLQKYITGEMVSDTLSEPFVWLQALQTAAVLEPGLIEEYSGHLNNVSDNRPYLLAQALNLWSVTESPLQFVERIERIIDEGNSLKSLYALNALSSFWDDLSNAEKSETLIQTIRSITFKALGLGDRGVAYAGGGLLADPELFRSDDFPRINQALDAFSLPGDIEVYQAFGSLYKDRFEEQAKPVIDSLAALGYVPLNQSLSNAGWEVSIPEERGTTFRRPNWERLWEMGRKPTWVLETEKGVIKVEVNTLSAPATISAIDSLTMAGAYNGIPFHRVVPNFVIQGGDIERQDGFGGPDFVIPTEASETAYNRGAAGIASAGIDTEGSQYFFMHQWKPHLNGGYTLFGNVKEGMDVVDRIIPGDKVLQAYWE